MSSPVARHWGHYKGRHSVVTQCEADSLGSSVKWSLNLSLCPLLCCVTSHDYGSHSYLEEMTGSGVFFRDILQHRRIEWVQAHTGISHLVLCCHSNETHAPIANSPNSAQLEAPPTIPPSYIRVHAVVWECGEGHTDGRDQYTFHVVYDYAKCNETRTMNLICCTGYVVQGT